MYDNNVDYFNLECRFAVGQLDEKLKHTIIFSSSIMFTLTHERKWQGRQLSLL